MKQTKTYKSTVSVSLETSKTLQAIRNAKGPYEAQKALEKSWLKASPFGLFLASPSAADEGRR